MSWCGAAATRTLVPARRAGSDAKARPDALLLVHNTPLFGNDMIILAARDEARGALLLIPPATQLGSRLQTASTLGEVPVGDDGAVLATSIENVLGVDVGTPVIVDDAGLTALLGSAAPVPIELPDTVELIDRGTKYPVGSQELSAAQAAEVMSGPQAMNQVEKIVVTAVVLDAWLNRLQDPDVARRTVALDRSLGPLVAAAQAPDRRIETLPVDSIPTGAGDRYQVRETDLAAYVERAIPGLRLGDGDRPRVEILNGTGALGVATAVAEKVIPAGGKVTLTDNVRGFGVPETQVVYYQDRWRRSAQRLLDAMGCGSLRRAGRDVKIADVTIVVGSDCPAYAIPGGAP